MKNIHYACTNCGSIEYKWQGKCPACHAWNTLIETQSESQTQRYTPMSSNPSVPQTLDSIEATAVARSSSGSDELDRVLGGGLVAGGVVLLGGDPGIGKSTLLLQTLCHISASQKALYISGEESLQQIALRAKRLAIKTQQLLLLAEINLETIIKTLIDTRPTVAVIDSIQTVYTEALSSAPGSVAQVRECSAQLTRLAKQLDISMILVGHVTKEGTLAGPRVLEHIVDTVLYFEGETHSHFRLIRACKNRFGAVNELGVFAMTEKGLRAVSNPSALFLSHHSQAVSGSTVTVTLEGSRPLLIEIQALVDYTHHPNPRRLCVGLESNRLAMLLAVLHRHIGVTSFDQDVFINAVGGVRISEPAADLAIICAILSSLKDKPLPAKCVIFGEIGLAGEVRPVQRGVDRLQEAVKLGFTHAIIPKANMPKNKSFDINLMAASSLGEAIAHLSS